MTAGIATPHAECRDGRFLVVPVGLILLFLIGLLLLPTSSVTPRSPKHIGVGAENIEPSDTGLLREWPELDQPYSDELASLGYQLFFDPVLSGNNDRSCASCHHPDWGFSEPNALAFGPDGEETALRHTPTLWNNAAQSNSSFSGDGRATTLEEQATESLTSDMEMVQDPAELINEIAAIPEYNEQFKDRR